MSAVIIPFPTSGRSVQLAHVARRTPAKEERAEEPLTPSEIAAIRKIFLDCPIARRARDSIDRDA